MSPGGGSARWDHPRACGEKGGTDPETDAALGSPPRVRGKEPTLSAASCGVGITPARAGKSEDENGKPCPGGGSPPRVRGKEDRVCRGRAADVDHPRVRGEKLIWLLTSEIFTGSPPRARGKGRALPKCPWVAGITPACAGKRQSAEPGSRGRRDHPRVRGEK